MVKYQRNKIFYISLVCVFLLLISGMIFGVKHFFSNTSDQKPDANSQAPDNTLPSEQPVDEPAKEITISATGDILIHNTLYFAAYNSSDNTYDFNRQFQYVKPLLMDSDITIANLETSLAGPEKGYSGYPKFNTPDSITDALKESGVDILTAANNHRLDGGVAGFYRTIRVVREQGLDIIGVKTEEKERTWVMKNVKGINVAVLNFGYGYPLEDGALDINGLILPMEMKGLIDTFDPQDLEKSIVKMKARVTEAGEAGADLIAVYMHWGDEYHRLPNDFQEKLAIQLVSLGVDVIFGGHPHVLQPAVSLVSAEGKRVPVFYSLGNFISDQRKETVDDIYTEQGMIAKVTFSVKKNEKPLLVSAEAIPTWVNKKTSNNRYVYEAIPATDALQSSEKFPLLTTADLDRIRFCVDTVKSLAAGL